MIVSTWFQKKIDQAQDNANEEWKKAAYRRVRCLAESRQWFTSEDVLTWLDQRNYKTRDKRALGAVMQHYQKAGWITPAGWVTAKRKERHHAPVRRWQSQKYGFKAEDLQ